MHRGANHLFLVWAASLRGWGESGRCGQAKSGQGHPPARVFDSLLDDQQENGNCFGTRGFKRGRYKAEVAKTIKLGGSTGIYKCFENGSCNLKSC